jgi:hypothetical protein
MSKLGFHISSGKHDDGKGFGLGQVLKTAADAGNPVPVIFSVDQNIWPDIEKSSPTTTYIFRHKPTVYNGQKHGKGLDGPTDIYLGDPKVVAHNWMATLMPKWAQNKAHYYAPLNEQDPAELWQFTWLNAFTIECMNIAEAIGYKLALYAFSGGNPKDLLDPVTGKVVTSADECWQELIPSLRQAKKNGHILLLHEYGFKFVTLRASAPYLALRYRVVYSKLPTDARPQLVISEASANMGFSGDPQVWLDDVKWYDSELLKDRAVIGCCLYQLGGVENLAQVLCPLAGYIAATPTPIISYDPAPVPVGVMYRVMCNLLYVRALPSTAAAKVGALYKGDLFGITETQIACGYEWGLTRQINDKPYWVALRQLVDPLAERV